MRPPSVETMPLRHHGDLLLVRQRVRERAVELGFGLLDQTKLITVASELGRNTVAHGGGGAARVETVARAARRGLRLTFEDAGPGIADIARALTDGYTSKRGMGLGLGGSRRLVDEFDIASSAGAGTTVTVIKWA